MSGDIPKRTFTVGLKLGQFRLQSVLLAGKKLNSTRALNEVLTSILWVSVSELNAETGTVYLVNETRDKLVSRVMKGKTEEVFSIPIDKGLAGAAFLSKEILNVADPYNDPRFDKTHDEETGFKTRNILSIPMLNRNGESIGVIQVINKKEGEYDSYDEEFAMILATFAAIAVENAKHVQFMIERERLEKELSLAHTIQSTFLQQDIPQLDGYDIWAVSRPCYEIGGDYMQLAKISETEYLAIIADVSGKGIPAALITLALHAAIMILLPIDSDTNKPQVVATRVEYTTLINEILRSVTGGRAFVTFCPVIIYGEENKLNFCNCGHTEPIIIRKNGKVERVASQTPVLGILENIEPVMESVHMEKGDIACMFTDGVDEASSGPADETGNRDEFGVDRLVELLKKNMKKSAMEITDTIIDAIEEYTSEYRIEDDVTLVIIKKK